jgi:hypothetical protein
VSIWVVCLLSALFRRSPVTQGLYLHALLWENPSEEESRAQRVFRELGGFGHGSKIVFDQRQRNFRDVVDTTQNDHGPRVKPNYMRGQLTGNATIDDLQSG